jgi:hypothetical protein
VEREQTKVKIIEKAIKLSYDSFTPNEYQRRYHYAIAFSGNKPILMCENNPIKVNAKAYKMGRLFNIKTYREFPYIHAESHLVSRLMDKYNRINTSLSIVVIRINRQGKILLSKPCSNCQKILDAVGLHKVYWSIDKQTFGSSFNKIYGV